MAIYLTGDCHGDFRRLLDPRFSGADKNDYLIVCGDFGGIWSGAQWEEEMLDRLERELPYTLLWIDGNHEGFDHLKSYQAEYWNGGMVQYIRPHVIHLMRGQVFEIDGKSIFAFGGASSHDIAGVILEPDDPDFKKKKKKLDQGWYPYRVNHVSWWKQELPSEEEMQEGIENLAAHDNKVDFIVTHCCASSTQTLLGGGLYKTDILTEYHEKIRQNTSFKKWFFGHYHDNRNVNMEEILIYEQMIRIW